MTIHKIVLNVLKRETITCRKYCELHQHHKNGRSSGLCAGVGRGHHCPWNAHHRIHTMGAPCVTCQLDHLFACVEPDQSVNSTFARKWKSAIYKVKSWYVRSRDLNFQSTRELAEVQEKLPMRWKNSLRKDYQKGTEVVPLLDIIIFSTRNQL